MLETRLRFDANQRNLHQMSKNGLHEILSGHFCGTISRTIQRIGGWECLIRERPDLNMRLNAFWASNSPGAANNSKSAAGHEKRTDARTDGRTNGHFFFDSIFFRMVEKLASARNNYSAITL